MRDIAPRAEQPVSERSRQPRFWPMARLWRYGCAVLLVLAAFGIRWSLEPVLNEELPFMLFIAAALVAARLGGAGPGLLAMLLGLVLSDYIFLRPKGTFALSTVVIFQILRYLFTGSLGIVLLDLLQRSRSRLEATQDLLRRHNAELEMRVAERTASLSTTVKSLEDILYHISHNLRAPIRAMRVYPDLLLGEYSAALSPEAKEYLARIAAAATRMDGLIADLLEYGRVTHAPLNVTQASLDNIVESAVHRMAFEIERRKADVKINRPLPSVRADAKLLEEAVDNLLENAIKFVSKNTTPRIEVSAQERLKCVRLSVKDNGIGLSPQYAERIFGAFERLNSAREYEGTGIGLAIVKQAVERMGGRVGVDSQLNAGSTFWLELPESANH
jgi:signal transduction histidine kinase